MGEPTQRGPTSKLPFTDMAHMELNIDFNLEKSRALIRHFKSEIYAKSEHCSNLFRSVTRSTAPNQVGALLRVADCGYLKYLFRSVIQVKYSLFGLISRNINPVHSY